MPGVRPRDSTGPRRSGVLLRLIGVLALTLAAGVGLARPAAAHNVLISSDPADGATLQAAPTTVALTFDQPVQNFEPLVTVLGPDGGRYESGAPAVDGTVVTTDVAALTVRGAYVIAYRIVSADGHPVQGEIRFELAATGVTDPAAGGSPAPGGPAGTATAVHAPADANATATTAPGLSGWLWTAIGLVAILVIAAAVVFLRRPR